MRGRHVVACVLALTFGGTMAIAQSSPADPSGDWRGTLDTGAVQLRVAFHLGAKSTFDSPDQGALGLPAQTSVADRTVTVSLGAAGQYSGTLSADGKTLDGTYEQGGARLPLRLERGTFASANRPQTPKPPFPYKAEEVGYDNFAHPGIHLAATLTIPQGTGPFPAALLITGSGTQDRDETIFEHKPFAVLADALTRRGIAVLRVDDRGAGKSSAGTPDDTTATYATDVEAGIVWLRSRKDIDPGRIGLLGHSEGGIIAPLVASKDPGIAFVVMWAGSGAPGEDVIVDQAAAIVAASGASAEQVKATADLQRAILDAVIASGDFASAKMAVNAAMGSKGQPPVPDASIAQLTSHWYRYFLSHDPAPSIRALKVPVLALLGGKDTQVTVALNEKPLREALAGNPKASVVVLPGLNHMFQMANTGAVSEYGQIEETIDSTALNPMVDWIVRITNAKPPKD